MKILHVIANLASRYGGPPKACIEMASAMVKCGHTVEVITTDQDGAGRLSVPINEPIVKDGVIITYFSQQIRRVWPISIPLARELAKRIREFDIVHIHSLYLWHGLIAAYYCRKYKVPYIIRPHGSLDPYIFKRHRLRKLICETLFEYRNLRKASAIHYTAEEEMILANSMISNIAPGVVVPLGLKLDDYSRLPNKGTFRSLYPEVGKRSIILFLGRINFKKGLNILIESFSRLVNLRDDIHLVLAGPEDTGYGQEVRDWIVKAGITQKATITGMLHGEQKLAALSEASVFVLPSYSENFGIAVAEAMACCLPVVVSSNVNIWREIEAARAGTIIACDARQCAAAILEILDNKELAHQMGKCGRRLVESQYNWSIVSKKLEEMYRNIVYGQRITPLGDLKTSGAIQQHKE